METVRLKLRLRRLHRRVPSRKPQVPLAAKVSSRPTIANQTAYEAGIANRQEYARKTFEAAPTEHVKSLVAKLSTLSNEDVRMAKYNSAYAKATPAERDFMDRKVEHMIHYGNE